MKRFSDLLEKGVTFTPLGSPLTPQDIMEWERIINAPLPEQYRDYLLHANGGELRLSPEHKASGNYMFDIKWPEGLSGKTPNSLLRDFFMIDDSIDSGALYTLTFTYNYNAWKEVLPPDTFPIATDPGGDYILIGLRGEKKGKIYYWMLESTNAMEEPEVAAYAYTGWVADSFVEFVLGLDYLPPS